MHGHKLMAQRELEEIEEKLTNKINEGKREKMKEFTTVNIYI